ncbi:MAG: hypothetical protein AAB437_03650 [Patescibacteria group bacterium]
MISDDFTIDYVNKRVYHFNGTTIYTVNELYSYLMDTFDELAQMDDTIPMSAQTPTEYTLINGWFMDDTSFKFLKTGAVQTNGWVSGGVRIKAYDGSGTGVGFVAGDIGKVITETVTGQTGTILFYDERTATEIGYVWIRPTTGSDTFANVSSAYTVASSTAAGVFTAASASGENLWSNIYTLGSIEEDDSQLIYIEQNGSRIFSGSEWWPLAGTRHIDVLIKVKEAGTEINGAQITVFLRHYPSGGNADLYDHFGIDLTAGGRNAVPLATSPDLNNTTATVTVSGYSDITVAFVNGTLTYSATSGSFTNLEAVSQAVSGATGIFLKQTTTTGAGVMTLGNVVGTFNNINIITGGTSGKTATSSSTLTAVYTMAKAFTQGTDYNYSVVIGCATRVLSQSYEYLKYVTRIGSTFTMYPTATAQGGAITHTTKQGQLYIRAHEDNQTTPTNTYSPVKASPFGTFAGGKFFGAQGVWIENMAAADVQNYQLIDATGATRTPPNQQAITISNLLSGDRVAVFRTTSGTTIDKAMYTAAAGNLLGNSTFVVNGAIPSDTPTSGSIRVVDISDTSATREVRYTYASWSGSTFSGVSPTLDRGYTATDDTAYVPFIDTTASSTSQAVTVVYSANRTILLRVRRKTVTPILPFETTGTFGSTGYSTSAIRTTDSIVT